ncbi:DUF4082 domain-containing protein [Brevibacillus porteri]|uniref:DUF4082 domain-containing protein n=1 Tax=Brevibacillus porteri TaxID=2126350 RepID=UPI003635D26C
MSVANFTGNRNGGFQPSTTFGAEFSVNKPIFATSMGVYLFEAGVNGGTISLQVGLWEKSSGSLLASAVQTVPYTGSPFTGQVQVTFSKSVKLNMSTTYVIGVYAEGTKAQLEYAQQPINLSFTQPDGVGFTVKRGVYTAPNGFGMPNGVDTSVPVNLSLSYVLNNQPTLKLISPIENLLGAAGNCEDVSLWKRVSNGGDASSVISLDAANKVYGNYAFKVSVPTGQTSEGIFRQIPMSRQSYYLLMADIKTYNASELRLRYYNGTIYSDKSVTSSTYTTPYIKINKDNVGSTDNWVSASVHGTAGQYGFVDGVRLYEIEKDVYDKIDVDPEYTGDKLVKKYPFTDPTTYLTMTEGAIYSISGSATDPDAGNVLSIWYKINNGTARAINSGVSDGSTPVSFAKNLTYRNKRLWDGATDVVGYDLAEGTNHTLYVWAQDDQGGTSPEQTRTFRVVWNRPPVISGTDKNLGTINTPPSESFSVTDPEGNPFTIEYYLDNVIFDSFPGVSGQTYIVTIPTDKWLRTSLTQHQLKVRAIDNQGSYSDRIFTFIRRDNRIEFKLNYSNPDVKSFFTTNQKANRILVTMDATIPTGATLLVEACNNAYDTQPNWEDITAQVTAGRGYHFTNTTSTSGKWGINVHFKIEKGTATETVLLNGFGGAFD